MGEEEEEDERERCFPALKLPFLHMDSSPEHPSSSSLYQTSASVPFKWEDRPGKPRPCSDIIPLPEPTKVILELPPCKFTKTPSPTTVLDGPYNVGRPKFSSFRLFRDSQDSFNTTPTPEGSALLLGARKSGKTRGFFGKFKGGKKEFDGGSCRFSPSSVSSSCDTEQDKVAAAGVKLQRNGSVSSSHKPSHLWTTIYQGIKQVIQWKSSKK